MASLNWSFLGGILTGTAMYFILNRISSKTHKTKINEKEDDCILFSPRTISLSKCLTHPCNQFFCSFCNYKKFLAHLRSAKRSLDICVYLITADEIAEIIKHLFFRGLFVRVIIDKQMSDEAHNSKMYDFMKLHIPTKVTKTDMMHNKFVIIDQKILITGSFNWTRQGTEGNYENAVILYNENIIKKYSSYFHNVWHSF